MASKMAAKTLKLTLLYYTLYNCNFCVYIMVFWVKEYNYTGKIVDKWSENL